MKSKHIENFDGIRASDKAKQKAKNTLTNYVNEVQANETAKKQKRFRWSPGRIVATASIAAGLVFCAILIPVMLLGPYPGGKEKSIKDYYEEYSYELPFEHTIGNNQSTLLYFYTELTMEQMSKSINESGYTASLHDNNNIKKIFITAAKNGFLYYFVIYDKSYLEDIHGSNRQYTLSECAASFNMPINSNAKEPYIYTFLFPSHFSGTWTNDTNVRIYCTFDKFAQFYQATGKNDAQIDYENKTVTFFCEGNSDRSWIRGNVIMQYVENENGNYVNIQPYNSDD
ncbi:MAG: hypothetical protein LBF12_07840 [Christensenellaceae bacterium]|nr:hypothetical protein [Christensenellaceae bacterium]